MTTPLATSSPATSKRGLICSFPKRANSRIETREAASASTARHGEGRKNMVEVEATKKKRVADRQITKDDGDSEPEDRDPDRAFDPNLTAGVFQKASSEEMSRRRIVR